MPHEKLPDPDWTKASDKSAAEWQAEAGIGDLPEEEKETHIRRLIAGVKGDAPPPQGPVLPGNGNGNGNKNGNGTNPPFTTTYKRWKPS
jgi:hypothetical protein